MADGAAPPRRGACDPDLEAALRRVVARAAGVPFDEVAVSTRLCADLDLDDYDVLELLEVVEEAFGLALPEDVRGIETVGDIESLLRDARRS